MDLVVYDDDEKRYVPWAVALAAVLFVALLTAGLTFALVRQAAGAQGEQALGGVGSPAPATSPTAGPAPTAAATPPAAAPTAVATPTAAAPTAAAAPTTAAAATTDPACSAALLRADQALASAEPVAEALADHTEITDELLAERITANQLLDRTLPVLTDGATARRRLEQALGAYRTSREQCPIRP